MQSISPPQVPNSPAGLQLRQTITASGLVSIPTNVGMVYAIVISSAPLNIGSVYNQSIVNQGWTIPASTCVVAATNGSYTTYGTLTTGYSAGLGSTPSQTFTDFAGLPSNVYGYALGAILLYY